MIIDFHSHLYPPEFQVRPGLLPIIFGRDALLERMEQSGVDATVVSNPFIFPPSLGIDIFSLDAVRRYNDYVIATTEGTRGTLLGLAAGVAVGGSEHLKETERAITHGGLRGVSISSSVQGEYLDSPRAADFFALMQDLDRPIFIHPQMRTVGDDVMGAYRLVELLGRPCDTTLTVARMIYAGVLERFPRLTVVLAHVGGAITMLIGRLNMGYELKEDPDMGPPWGPDTLTKPPSEYLKMLYVDTMCFHPPALRCAIDTLGADHVLLGSDHPRVKISMERTLDTVKALLLPPDDEAKVLGGNAARLLKLEGG